MNSVLHSTALAPKPCLTGRQAPKKDLNSQIRFYTIILFMLVAGFKASAQEEIINKTTLWIAEGKYNDAEKYLDSVIHVEPKNVTALMMKGNVLLNYSLMQTPALQNITADDESIFSKDVATLANHVVVVPKATALQVARLWKQCLQIDSSRLDIRKGLCSLYGMALMQNELLGELPIIAKASGDKGDVFAYTLVEYAKLLQERGDKEGAYMTYKKIAELYPTVSGIWCVLASAYFAGNDLVHARECAVRGITTVNADMVACRDALDLYSAIGEPEKVLPLLKIAAKDPAYKDYPFYLAIYKFAYHDTSWRQEISAYLKQFPKAPDSNAVYAAASLMALKEFPDNYAGLGTLMNYNLNDFSTRLLTARAMHDYKDSTLPYFIAALVAINDKNYTSANELLSLLCLKKPGASDLLYYYAYSLYCSRGYKEALIKWTEYEESVKKTKSTATDIDTYLGAPYYFVGQCYLNTDNKVKAIEYFKMIVAGKDDSKYAYLAKIMLDKLSK